MRKMMVAANWKMHSVPAGGLELDSAYHPHAHVDVAVFPTFPELALCVQAGLHTGAQCGHPEDSGAYTGDVSMRMIRALECRYVLCGHSERRRHHGETDAYIASQVASALRHGLIPILCVGETDGERRNGEEKDRVRAQIESVALTPDTVIAYEPVWAIGTGEAATAAQAQEMHAFIRSLLPEPSRMQILYGGSINAENAGELFAQPDIDGGLVGGSSLKQEEFRAIVGAAALCAQQSAV